jgi:hypothetical protein
MLVASGTPTSMQVQGDCHKNVCDGNGGVTSAVDNSDVPDDGNPCTTDACNGGTPQHQTLPAGTACGVGLTCAANGTCTGCAAPTDCPGTDTECKKRTCTLGACGFSFTPQGTAVSSQMAGDCHKNVCDGMGGVTSIVDDTDVLVDGKACTSDLCMNGVPSNPNAPAGTMCSQNGGTVCDGSGACVQCVAPTDCPATGNVCLLPVCNAGMCSTMPAMMGTPAMMQTPGDCKLAVCDGMGGVTQQPDDSDVPVDGKACTSDVCMNGVPSNPALPAHTSCNQNGGTMCDGNGACVQCIAAADCPMPPSPCVTAACNMGTCGTAPVAMGTPLGMQTPGDCQIVVCDGNGGTTSQADNTDVPADDGNSCTSDTCSNGAPVHPALAAGTACNTNGGVVCDGQAVPSCTQTFTLVRVGTGAAALAASATATFLETYYPTLVGGAPVSVVALPTTASGGNQALLLGGTSGTEGGLSRSADGHYVTLAGYAGAAGSATTGTTRVVGRMDAAGNVDTSTRLASSAFSGQSVRGATSLDGQNFWVSGNGNTSSGGVWYVPLGASGGTMGGTQIVTAPNNARLVNVFGGQLYGSAGSVPYTNVFTIGTGTPTMAGATATSLPGMPTTTGPTPLGFVLFDLNPNVPGLDTMFVADSSLQKWTFDGTTWTKDATFTVVSSSCLGVTGWVTSTGVTLVVTTSASALRVDVPTTGTPTSTTLFSAATNTAFRGVALAPH